LIFIKKTNKIGTENVLKQFKIKQIKNKS